MMKYPVMQLGEKQTSGTFLRDANGKLALLLEYDAEELVELVKAEVEPLVEE